MKFRLLSSLALLPFIVACSTTPLSVELKPGAQDVIVSKEKPKEVYELVAPVTVSHGRGCRDFGYLGDEKSAIKELKNKTLELQGDYVQITTINKPHLDGGCYVNKYEIMALVYRKSNAKKAQASAINSQEEIFTKKMRELKSLYDDNVLSKDEYNLQKAKLLKQGFTAK